MQVEKNLSSWVEVEGKKYHIERIIKGDKSTIKDFAKFLNELISMGYGDYNLYASTQDGASYEVRCEIEVTPFESGVKYATIG